MVFFISLLGGILGIILAIVIIIVVIYFKVKAAVGPVNMKDLKESIKKVKEIEREEYSREKNVRGLTNLLESDIIRDFPDFNKDLIFSICESNLRTIFNCIENKNDSKIRNDDNFTYIKGHIAELIEDMKSNDIYEKFDDIQFYRHAINAYHKNNGKATIKISSTLSYYYKTNIKDKKVYPELRKQTRYTSEFVYVYDESKIDDNQVFFSAHCPNCGAPLKKALSGYCEYCSTYIKDINLKLWKMSSYKEDYK